MKAAYLTPAVTLLQTDGSPDDTNNRRLYEHLLQNRMDGILVLGSIGEFFALSLESRRRVARIAVETAAHRVKVLVGTGGMILDEVVQFSNECLAMGADGVVVVSPYYFALDDDACFAYYDRLAAWVNGPIYLYNFPDRTGYNLSPEVVLRLAVKRENIVGIKDTLPGMSHTRELIRRVKPVRPDFEIYSGFDDHLAANVLSGGDGCIAGLSNVFPEICADWTEALRREDGAAMARGQQAINRLFEIYSISSAFIPVIKEAVRLRGIVDDSRCTFPFAPLTPQQRQQLEKLLSL